MNRIQRCSVALAVLLALAGVTGANKDVPYVPTPEDVVARMIEMAAVTDRDTVYDLGCGDGRIVITAAQEKGARGVGIDIDPERIDESRVNAATAGVDGRVSFRVQDLFETDFSDATVVMMYLLPSVNLRLRPILFQQLRPGTRLVSHSFSMGEWEPDNTVKQRGSTLYYWIMPANVSGEWTWGTRTPGGREDVLTMRLEQSFQHVSGWIENGASSSPVEDASLVGNKISFRTGGSSDGIVPAMRLSGAVLGDRIEGAAELQEGTASVRREGWVPVRTPDSAKPLDPS